MGFTHTYTHTLNIHTYVTYSMAVANSLLVDDEVKVTDAAAPLGPIPGPQVSVWPLGCGLTNALCCRRGWLAGVWASLPTAPLLAAGGAFLCVRFCPHSGWRRVLVSVGPETPSLCREDSSSLNVDCDMLTCENEISRNDLELQVLYSY